LWNVLKGDMSLVGPRPLLVRYLERYDEVQQRRHEVRPGMTGLAQTNGRNALGWEQRLALDVEYVEKRSLILDIQILARTVVSVLRRQGITDGSVTSEEFMGFRSVHQVTVETGP
jgi:lipopolysaccharide/colanic/teichoic acid biosynthesis glycosyltransferase